MNSLIERVKSAMVGLGTGWILVLMLVLSIISLAIMLERAWLYWSLRDDIDALMRDLGPPAARRRHGGRAPAARGVAQRRGGRRRRRPRRGRSRGRRRRGGHGGRERAAAHEAREAPRVPRHAGKQRPVHRAARDGHRHRRRVRRAEQSEDGRGRGRRRSSPPRRSWPASPRRSSPRRSASSSPSRRSRRSTRSSASSAARSRTPRRSATCCSRTSRRCPVAAGGRRPTGRAPSRRVGARRGQGEAGRLGEELTDGRRRIARRGRRDHRDQRHPARRHHARAPHHLHGDDEDRAQSDRAARPAQGGDGDERRAGVFSIIMAADGRAWSTRARSRTTTRSCRWRATAQAQHPDLRAVIKADAAVTHGRVIHVLDLLKQAHVNKIAFGVTPDRRAAPAPQPGRSPPEPPSHGRDARGRPSTDERRRTRALHGRSRWPSGRDLTTTR